MSNKIIGRDSNSVLLSGDLLVAYVCSAPKVDTSVRKCIFALKQCQWSPFSIQERV